MTDVMVHKIDVRRDKDKHVHMRTHTHTQTHTFHRCTRRVLETLGACCVPAVRTRGVWS